MNSLTQAQMDVLIRNLLRMLEGLSFDLPKDVEHSWGKLSSLLQEPNRYPIDLLREATLTLHRLGCFKSFEDRGDTFVCGGLSKLGGVRLEQMEPVSSLRKILGSICFAVVYGLIMKLQQL